MKLSFGDAALAAISLIVSMSCSGHAMAQDSSAERKNKCFQAIQESDVFKLKECASGLQQLVDVAGEVDASFRASISGCMKGPDSALRRCLEKVPVLQALAAPEPKAASSPDSQWRTTTEVEKLDGSKSVYVSVNSSDRLQTDYGRDKEGRLAIRCVKNQTELLILWPEYVGSGRGHQVKWRLDGEPIITEWWNPASGGGAVFSPAAIVFIKKLFRKKELIFSLAPYNKIAQTLTFPVTGLEEAIKPLREACKW